MLLWAAPASQDLPFPCFQCVGRVCMLWYSRNFEQGLCGKYTCFSSQLAVAPAVVPSHCWHVLFTPGLTYQKAASPSLWSHCGSDLEFLISPLVLEVYWGWLLWDDSCEYESDVQKGTYWNASFKKLPTKKALSYINGWGLLFPIFMIIFNKIAKRLFYFLLPITTEYMLVASYSDYTAFLPEGLHPFLWTLPRRTQGNDHI